MKICRLIFSTNRLQYLVRTLDSFRKLDFGDHEVHSIFIDDYPKNRDNEFITTIAKHYGYDQIILHEENMGLTATWAQANKLMGEHGFDYIWHQEDDVELLYPLHIDSCIRLLQQDSSLSQVTLKRQPWYYVELENPTTIEPDDIEFENYRYAKKQAHFWTMASCYPYYISQMPYKQITGYDPSEGVVMEYLKNYHNLSSAVLKCQDGTNIVNHIGEVTKGKRISTEGDPSYDFFAWMDPNKNYDAKTGHEVSDNENR